MKYGILKYSADGVNLGDYAQLEGIRQAYKIMGIAESELVEIERDLISEYEGDYVILPMTGFFSNLRTIHMFPWPERIIPVYLGFHCEDESVIEEIYNVHRQFGPFGCRDLCTMSLMRRNGLEAYMSGCMSICYSKREKEPTAGKVFLYDPPEELIEYIPEELLKNSERIESPVRQMKYPGYDPKNAADAKELVNSIFNKCKEEAALVITRRLHVALPCTAMGIPVVLAHTCHDGDIYDSRFSGLDRIIRPYKPSEYCSINWNPEPADIEGLKVYAMDLAVQKLKEAYEKWNNLCTLSGFYEDTKPAIYYEGMKAAYISNNQKKVELNRCLRERTLFEEVVKHKFEAMHLVFYGAGDKAQWALRRYYSYILRCKDFSIVDGSDNKIGKKTNDVFTGVRHMDYTRVPDFVIQEPDHIRQIDKRELVVIVTANAYYEGVGVAIGNRLTEKYGLREGKEFFFLDKLNNSLELPLSEVMRPYYHLEGF